MGMASPPISASESFIGTKLKITTTFGEEIEGDLFCFDTGEKSSNTVIISQPLANGNVNYKILKANVIKEVVALSAPNPPVDDPLPHVDLQRLGQRAQTSEDLAAQESKKYGVGVTEHAQEVFDCLSKTYEPEWEGEDIKILGVKISKPYDPVKNITGANADAVSRIQKVLQGELSKLRSKKQTK